MPAERVRRFFAERGVEVEEHIHGRAVTAQEVAHAEHVSGWAFAKPVMVMAGKELSMLVLPAASRLDLELARRVLQRSDLRLAREDEFAPRFPDCEVGAEPPVGTVYGMAVWIDENLLEADRLVFRGGSHDRTLSVSLDGYLHAVEPRPAELAEQVKRSRRASRQHASP